MTRNDHSKGFFPSHDNLVQRGMYSFAFTQESSQAPSTRLTTCILYHLQIFHVCGLLVAGALGSLAFGRSHRLRLATLRQLTLPKCYQSETKLSMNLMSWKISQLWAFNSLITLRTKQCVLISSLHLFKACRQTKQVGEASDAAGIPITPIFPPAYAAESGSMINPDPGSNPSNGRCWCKLQTPKLPYRTKYPISHHQIKSSCLEM